MAKVYSAKGVRTVIGGPHARAFPSDCLRFFDYVVHSCDQALIRDVLAGEYAPGSIVRSERPLDEIPSAEERLPEILSWPPPRAAGRGADAEQHRLPLSLRFLHRLG